MAMEQMVLIMARLVQIGWMLPIWDRQEKEVRFLYAKNYRGQYGNPLSLDEIAEKLRWDADWREQMEALGKEQA